jgi:ABC-type dipeptide/oligopeptide/nickel transport system permease component
MTNLAAYIARRLILLIFVLIGVTALIFAVTMLLPPGIRAHLYVTNFQQLTGPKLQRIIEQFGLNDPFYLQYGRWLGQVLQGNLGWSTTASSTVTEALAARWPYTFEIVVFAAPLIIFIGIYLGVQSAIHKDGIIDHASRILSIVGWSLPSFWLGSLLITIFFSWLHWPGFEPSAISTNVLNWITSSASNFHRYTRIDLIDGLLNLHPEVTWNVLLHCVMPVTVIVVIDIALLIRVMRSSMLEALSKPYVTTARAKGLSKKVVIYKHARRNALIPVATLSGMLVAGLLGGLVITETVFNFGGLGQWAATSALRLDIPSVLGYAMLTAVMFVIANLIVDILYAYIDPRIRLE